MIVERAIDFLDERLGSAGFTQRALRKVFPDHWSFMIGEVGVYAFGILLVTGTFLAAFFDESTQPVTYHGSYAPLVGRVVPASFDSVMQLSFAVPLGLFIRQMHHWAALVFLGALVFHMSRVFFTGAFRKPRELNWIVGLTLLLLVIGEGFTGYSLPGDAVSGAGLRIAYSVAEAIPVIGTWIAFGFFDGRFPTEVMTARLFVTHVLLIPATIAALLALHLGMVWRQHHTQFAGPGRSQTRLVGSKLWPSYAFKSIGLQAATVAVIALLGGLFTVNPIWIYGPFDPWTVPSPAQPDWYVAWLDGALRIGPAWALHLFGHTVPPLFWPAILMPLLLFGTLYAWPFIEARLSGDTADHNLDDMPYDRPWRLGAGIAVVSFGTILGFAASDDVQAKLLHVPVENLMLAYRCAVLLLPPALGLLAVRIGIEMRARLRSRTGIEAVRRAVLRRNARGGYEEDARLPSARER